MLNKFIAIGRMVREIDMKRTDADDNKVWGKFTIAVDRSKKKDVDQEADFINCRAYGQKAKFIQKYFPKGKPILIEGNLQSGSYTNAEGHRIYYHDVFINEVDFVPSDHTNNRPADDEQALPAHETFITDMDDDELPFR